MRQKRFSQFMAFLLCTSSLVMNEVILMKEVIAAPRGQMYVPYYQSNGALLPDWNRITFETFPTVSSSGSLDLSALTSQLGYDPSRQWTAGTPITSILMLGDLADVTNLPQRSLENILNTVGISKNAFTLADFGVVDKQTIQTLIDAVPSLSNMSLADVQPLYDLVKTQLGSELAASLRDSPLSSLVNIEQIAGLKLNSLDLSRFGLDSIPGLLNANIGNFSQWGNTLIGQIPGLANLPFSNFFTDLGSGGPFAIVDVVFGEKEAHRTNTVTGSTNVGFHYSCHQNNCAHVELAGPEWLGIASTLINGKQWISGNSQRVSGGSGCLSGKEPTGRHPFGRSFKVVLGNTDEASGRADFNIYFRFKLWCGRSPYIIGPFPWMTQYEKDLIFLGLD